MLKLSLASFFFCFFLLFLLTGASHHYHAHRRHNHIGLGDFRPTKLFVFGDSYADTGNDGSDSPSYNIPYGITFPGEPAGRYSDGRVLTDYVAMFLGLETPLAYRWWNKSVDPQYLQNGINFAYGGTGVFQTLSTNPNMTEQIGFLDQLLNESVYTEADIQSSVALVTLCGNDYLSHFTNSSTQFQDLSSFIISVVNQLTTNLKKISDLGVKKIAVVGLQPLGCLPLFTATTLQCNDLINYIVGIHNDLLQQGVATLNNETDGSEYIILDLYTSFKGAFNSNTTVFENPLKMCCAGTSTSSYCGSVDQNGEKQYTVCDDPESAFFWDGLHPTQSGWGTVYEILQPTLQKLLDSYTSANVYAIS